MPALAAQNSQAWFPRAVLHARPLLADSAGCDRQLSASSTSTTASGDVDALIDRRAPVESRCGAVAVGLSIAVAAPFGWRCPMSQTMAPFPHPAHRTGHADLPHPALGQDLTPSPTAGRCLVLSVVRDRSARRGARVDRSRPCSS